MRLVTRWALKSMFRNLGVLVAVMAPGLVQAQIPMSKHVVLVVEENHGYDAAIRHMPALKQLADANAVVPNFYANHHPSIGNYFIMTTGRHITNDDGYKGTDGGDANLISQIIAAHKTWKVYADGLPEAGYVDGGSDLAKKNHYVKRHVPIAYFEVVRNDPKQRANLVPFDQFQKDLQSADGLPDFSLIIPNLVHDAHGIAPFFRGSLAVADNWLKTNVTDPLFSNDRFKKDGLLIVTFDEAGERDSQHGGGHIATVLAGPTAQKCGAKCKADHPFYQHQSLFVTLEAVLGLPRLDIVKDVPDLGIFFTPLPEH